MNTIFAYTEDLPSRALLSKILHRYFDGYSINFNIPRGNSKIKSDVDKYIKIGYNYKSIILTDLDKIECPKKLKDRILIGKQVSNNFKLLISIQEIESWIMADVEKIFEYFNINIGEIQLPTDSIQDPKEFFLRQVNRFSPKEVKYNIVKMNYSTKHTSLSISPFYNSTLVNFIDNYWDLENASKNSRSLQYCLNQIELLRST